MIEGIKVLKIGKNQISVKKTPIIISKFYKCDIFGFIY